MSGLFWTEEEEEILRKAAEKELTAKQLVSVLKSRSENAINQKAALLGISLRGGKPEIDREAYEQILKEIGEG